MKHVGINNKGFTLVEVLSVIVLIALLFGIGIPGIMKISDNMKIRSYNTKVDLLEQAGELWGQDNQTLLQTNICSIDSKNYRCYKVPIKDLINEDYLESENKSNPEFKNPKDDSSMLDNCVYIYKKNNRVYAKYSTIDGEMCDNNLLTQPVIVDPPKITSNDNILSGGWHNANFTLTFSSNNGTSFFYGYDIGTITTSGNSVSIDSETNSRMIYVKACINDICSNPVDYEIRLDKTGPTITENTTYVKSGIVTLKQNATYNLDNYVTISDNLSSSSNITVTKSSFGGTGTIGTYSVTYTATDAVGNSSSKTISINVISESVFVSNYKSSTSNVYRCTNNGTSWSCPSIFSNSTGNTLGLSVVDSNTVFVSNYKSSTSNVYRCTNNGTSWNCPSIFSNSTGNTLGIAAVDSNTVFVSNYKSSTSNVYRCTNNGTSWSCPSIFSNSTGNTLGLSAVDSNTVFVSNYKSSTSNVYRCTNNGTSWSCPSIFSNSTGKTLWISAVDSNTVFVSNYKLSSSNVYRCTNNGTSWSCPSIFSNSTGNILGLSAVDKNTVFVSNYKLSTSNVYRCTNNGTSWSCPSIFSNSTGNTLRLSAVDSNTVFVSNYESSTSNVYRCTNNGTSWSCPSIFSNSTGDTLGISALGSHSDSYTFDIP